MTYAPFSISLPGGRWASRGTLSHKLFSDAHTHTHTFKQPEECGQPLPTLWVRRREHLEASLDTHFSILFTVHQQSLICILWETSRTILAKQHHYTKTPSSCILPNCYYYDEKRYKQTFRTLSHTARYWTRADLVGLDEYESRAPPTVTWRTSSVFLWMGVGHHEWIDDTHSGKRRVTNVHDVDSIDVFCWVLLLSIMMT